jgi:hypothetical protein
MQATNTDKTDIESEKLELDRRRLELEELKFTHAKAIDEKKLKADRSSKLWSQFSIFTPVVVILLGFALNSYSERLKVDRARFEETNKQKRQFIEKQLSEFYYPIQLRLNKDNAFFEIWRNNQQESGDMKIARKIEDDFVLPNHEEIIKIIDAHFDLIKNDSDDEEKLYPLMDAMKAYERHVAVYKALKETGDTRKPIQLRERFPKEFFGLIDKRIAELENRRDDLLP